MEKRSGRTLVLLQLALIQGILGSSAVEVKASVNPARVGDTVTLALSPATALKSGSWAVGRTLILTWSEDQQAVFPGHNGRASVSAATGALTLTSVTVADTGEYVVKSTDPQLTANANLMVLEPVSGVKLAANDTDSDLVEFTSSFILSCSSSGSSLSYLWLNGSCEVTASGAVQLSNGNSTLTIANVTRYDQGPFRCNVSNLISHGVSQPLHLNITYGPDSMSFTVNGLNVTSFYVGSNLTMSCSAKSNPPAELQWAVNGELLNRTGPELELYSVREDQWGLYSCVAFNNGTNKYSNITKQIIISKPLPSGSVQLGVSVWLLLLFSLAGALL